MCENYTDFLEELKSIYATLGELPPIPEPPKRKYSEIVTEIRRRMVEQGIDGTDFAETVAAELTHRERRGLYLVGNVGSGKTRRTKFMQSILQCRFYTAQEIVDTYGAETAWSQLFRGWNSVNPCNNDIIVDDLGTESTQVNLFGKVVDPMALFIQGRYERKLRVHFTTNLNPAEIKKRYGERVHSRLLEMCKPIQLLHADRRKEAI